MGQSFWLPLILISLSVLGVMAGVVMRVRSFVLLGITFMVMVLLSLICHAAFGQQHIWVLYVFILGMGAAIIAFFGVFAKKRSEILAAVERFRGWQRRKLLLKESR